MHNKKLLFWALTSALAGFLFGFDTVVISGAEQTIQRLWGLNTTLHGLAISMALWGTVVGSLIGGWPTERFGRRKTLISIGALYFISAIASAYAPEVYSFMIARFIGGLGVGICTVAAPLYISEISPPKSRGWLAGMFQFNIVFGILMAFLSNSVLSYLGDNAWGWIQGENAWRWMLGVEAIPALVYSVLCFGLPESPRWLITHGGDRQGGINVFRQINPAATDQEIQKLANEVEASVHHNGKSAKFFTKRLITPISLAFMVAFFNQLSGINAILYFAPRIFEMAGLASQAAMLQSVGIGVTLFVFTFVGLLLIDKLGRRTLLYIGSFGYIVSLGLCAMTFSYYAPQFKVAITSMAVVQSIENVQKAEGSDLYSDADRTELAEEYEEAKIAFCQASSNEEYQGQPVVIPDSATHEAEIKIAETASLEATEFIGIGSTIVLFCIFGFIASHSIGQGTVIWVLISEIFPNRNRASGQALGSFTHWIFAALITLFFPMANKAFEPATIFGFFCFMMVLHLLWVKLMVPETKGVPLEEMQKKLGIE
jgi:SP family arabinose:H+ symporter-like MFS transporter